MKYLVYHKENGVFFLSKHKEGRILICMMSNPVLKMKDRRVDLKKLLTEDI
jgi:hypothetical protein